ncbi:MAG: DUF2924 domain-containing protein [Hyphomicrobiales bacterium]
MHGHTMPPTSLDLSAEIAGLSRLSRGELIERWQSRFGCPPPNGISRKLLERVIAYGMQTDVLGGLRPNLQQKLLAGPGKSRPVARKTVLKPGVRLVREWNGKTHHVEVTEDGFSWNGAMHGSLSGIAREITGTQWSGPRFFGLRS